ncbi:unnamed protein product [Spirodela intermedia]|uniref:C2 domain-containing protein n=1 Tax=Spirodela intermedia TaxID=51605 RepID=A0A7I8K2I8_SPIIN|nr:unnamed protein product [Spirodela intermedia]
MSTLKVGVEVGGAQNLMAKEGQGSSSSFVELQFAGQKLRTSTKEKDLNPVWDERFYFNVPDPDLLPHLALEACVYSASGSSNPSSKSFLGKVRLAGTSFVPYSDAVLLQCPLEKRGIFSRVRGELGLKVYVTDDPSIQPSNPLPTIDPFANPPPSPIFRAQAPPASPHAGVSAEKKGTRSRHSFHHLPKGKRSPPAAKSTANEMRAEPSATARVFAAVPSSSSAAAVKQGFKATAKTYAGVGGQTFKPPMGNTKKRTGGGYDLVEQMRYLFVRVVKGRDLAAMELAGTVDPYVEVRLGNYRGRTRTFEKNQNPEWNQVFAFAGDKLQASELEVVVKDKSLLRDDHLGMVRIDLNGVPDRVPPDSPLAPEWYRLENKKGEKLMSELMLAVWLGSQADETFPDAVLSDETVISEESAASSQLRGKVYHAPRLWYVRVKIIEAQDIVPLGDESKPAEVRVSAQVGRQIHNTKLVQTRNMAAIWGDEFMFVVAEPFEEHLVLTLQEKVGGSKNEDRGTLPVHLANLEKRADDRPVLPIWRVLEKPGLIDVDQLKKNKFATRLHIIAHLDGGYHVFDEPIQFSSDLRPTARQLWKGALGLLEIGIRHAVELSPIKNHEGKGSCDAYCVAKYGNKWVRTRTVPNSLQPMFNEQYTWEVYEPATVLTVAVFDNSQVQVDEKGSAARDTPMGKVRIRLSTLEAGRVYTSLYPLLALRNSGVKKMGELQLAVRFSSMSTMNLISMYFKPLYPKMHYTRPLPIQDQQRLRSRAVEVVVARLGRMEPPLRKEVIEYVSEVSSDAWSMRKGRANFFRFMALFSGAVAMWNWFGEVCRWKNPSTTVLVHVLFFVLLGFPELILPTAFLYMFTTGLWNYFHRPTQAPRMDMKLSRADDTSPDDLDEELDTFPSSRAADLIRHRYDRLRHVAAQAVTIAGDIATKGERLQTLLSWRDPRATFIFWVFCLVAALFLYVVPFKVVCCVFGFYVMRHPKFRTKLPMEPANFFRRLPARIDSLL